jgi:hypothetical protein
MASANHYEITYSQHPNQEHTVILKFAVEFIKKKKKNLLFYDWHGININIGRSYKKCIDNNV